MQLSRPATMAPWRAALWIVVIVGASLGFSRAFACATPFVALATVAGTQMPARTGAVAIVLAWGANQAVGFGLLHYPQTWDTFAWGGAIGVAAMAAWGVAVMLSAAKLSAAKLSAAKLSEATPAPLRVAAAFVAGFAAYEGLLYAATFVLPTLGDAFTASIIARIALVNAAACLGLLAVDAVVRGTEPSPASTRGAGAG